MQRGHLSGGIIVHIFIIAKAGGWFRSERVVREMIKKKEQLGMDVRNLHC